MKRAHHEEAGSSDVEKAARTLHAQALVWDQHGCLPLRPNEDDVEMLELYRTAGVDHVSVNVGFDLTSAPPLDTFKRIAAYRRGLLARSDRFLLTSSVADIHEAKNAGKLAVTLDVEGTEPLDGELASLETLHQLGVRTVLIAYNRRNRAGGGCDDDPNVGLTKYGRELVREMNRLGILVDASHCSVRTTFDLFELSSTPVVFSHSVPAGVKAHYRNISDDQMRASAMMGGVVGINGVGIFLGNNDASTDALVRAIEYAVNVVGIQHVGLGLDYVFPRDTPTTVNFVNPSQLPELTGALLQRGYSDTDVRAILGENFMRVASYVWR